MTAKTVMLVHLSLMSFTPQRTCQESKFHSLGSTTINHRTCEKRKLFIIRVNHLLGMVVVWADSVYSVTSAIKDGLLSSPSYHPNT